MRPANVCLRTPCMLLLVAWLAACAGNGEGLDANGRPLGASDPGDEPLTADFESIQAHVFTPRCTSCHAGGAAPEGLRLDAGSSYDLLVGVPSVQQPSTLRVAPGEPDASYLVRKLEGAAGTRMPLGGPYLDQATIDVIRQWITDGAQRSPAGVAGLEPFGLAAAAPADGAVLTTAPATLVVAFTRELDRTRIDTSNVRLDRLAVDATASDAAAVTVPARVVVTDVNPAAVQVRPLVPLAPGRYALRLDATQVADLAGARLPTGEATLTIRFQVIEEAP
jgi:hypothetical protein